MKILKTSFLPLQSNSSQIKYQPSFCGHQEPDTFTRSNVEQDTARAILENPSLLDKYTAFVRDAFLKLAQSAYGTVQSKPEENIVKSEETHVDSKLIEKQAQKITELNDEIERLKKENLSVKDELHRVRTQVPVGYGEGVFVKYPRKVGCSKKEKQLIELVESIRLPEETAQKLTETVYNIHLKDKEEQKLYVERLYEDFSKNKFDTPALIATVDSYFDKICSQDSPVGEEQSQKSEVELVKFEFPKRSGLLSDEQKELKSVAETLRLPAESAEKLTEICKELIKSYKKEPKNTIEKKRLTKIVKEALDDNKNDVKALVQQIDKYYEKLIVSQAQEAFVAEKNDVEEKTQEEKETPAAVEVSTEPQVAQSQKPSAEPVHDENFMPLEIPELKTPVILGQIDLDKVDPRRRRKLEKEAGKLGKKSVSPKTTTLKAKKKENNAVHIRKPATAEIQETKAAPPPKFSVFFKLGDENLSISDKIFELLLTTKNNSKFNNNTNRNLKWRRLYPAKSAILDDLKNELEKVKLRGSDAEYKNINSKNLKEVYKLINSDERFKELFGTHGAMRFIDRFVDLKDKTTPLEEQCRQKLDALEHLMEKSFKRGVRVTRTAESKHVYDESPYFCANIKLFPDEEDAKILGSEPIIVVLCDKLGETSLDGGLICTICQEDRRRREYLE